MKDQKDDYLRDENDEFRITMAQNIFAREESIEVGGSKLKKKKKKKFSPYRKKQEEVEGEESIKIVEDEFNPYKMDDPMDMPDLSSITRSPSKSKRRKK